MTTLALSQPAVLQWNWPRVGALSGALSLHFIAFVLLLVPPTAMTLLRPALPDVTDVRILEPPPRQLEEPVPPTPKKIVHEVRQVSTPPKPVQTPVAPPVESQMPSQVADPGPPGPTRTPTAPADLAPVALPYNTRTRIPYPLDAAKLRQQGTVILNVLVGSDGLPQTVEIEKSSGFRALDFAARDAVRHWTFQAGTRNGISAALWARVPITFSLQTL
jgi:protein TonB